MNRIYCDASISPATMSNPLSSQIGTRYVGRIVLICRELDYGKIEQVDDGVLTKEGNPASQQLEVAAIDRALEEFSDKQDQDYEVFSDNIQAVDSAESEHVKFVPIGEFHPASAFLARVMNRPQYLRSSSRKVTLRTVLTPMQKEIFEYFQAKELTFRLSERLVWKKIVSELEKSHVTNL